MRIVLIVGPRSGVMLASTQANGWASKSPEVTLRMAVIVVNEYVDKSPPATENAGSVFRLVFEYPRVSSDLLTCTDMKKCSSPSTIERRS